MGRRQWGDDRAIVEEHSELLEADNWMKHCVVAVSNRGKSLSSAFAICAQTGQDAGYYKAGTKTLTSKGKRVARAHAAESKHAEVLKAYETLVDRKEPKESLEEALDAVTRKTLEDFVWSAVSMSFRRGHGRHRAIMYPDPENWGITSGIEVIADMSDKRLIRVAMRHGYDQPVQESTEGKPTARVPKPSVQEGFTPSHTLGSLWWMEAASGAKAPVEAPEAPSQNQALTEAPKYAAFLVVDTWSADRGNLMRVLRDRFGLFNLMSPVKETKKRTNGVRQVRLVFQSTPYDTPSEAEWRASERGNYLSNLKLHGYLINGTLYVATEREGLRQAEALPFSKPDRVTIQARKTRRALAKVLTSG
jgi:hypothetical protein